MPSPERLEPTRRSWRLLAAHVVAEARYRRVGHSGLEPTAQGFTTPRDEPGVVAVELDELVVGGDDGELRRPVTTVGQAQAWVLGEIGPPRWGAQPGLHDPPPAVPADERLDIDPGVAAWLGGWFLLGYEALNELVADATSTHAGVPTLWPEHFDVGVELLADERRASYGVSAGDERIGEAYAYVAVWEPERHGGLSDPWWNATVIRGAVLTAPALAQRTAPYDELLMWLRTGRDKLLAAQSPRPGSAGTSSSTVAPPQP